MLDVRVEKGERKPRLPPVSGYLSCVFLEIRMSDLVSKVGFGSVFLLHCSNILSGVRGWVLRVERSGTRPLRMPGLGFLFASERPTRRSSSCGGTGCRL